MKKIILPTLLLLVTAALPPALHAHGDHEPSHESAQTAKQPDKGGPNGGRVVKKGDALFELLVQPDRHLRITRLDAKLKPASLDGMAATGTGGDRSAPVRFAFAAKGETLVSDQPLPEGNRLPLILQVKPKPDAPAITERLTVDLAKCPTCEHQEYACICDH